eukprot:572238_1
MGCCLSSAKPDEDLELDKDLMALEEANGGTGDPPENFVDNGKFGFANLMDGVRSGFSKVKNFDRIKSGADKFFDKDRTYNQRMPLVVALLLCIMLTLALVYGGVRAGHWLSGSQKTQNSLIRVDTATNDSIENQNSVRLNGDATDYETINDVLEKTNHGEEQTSPDQASGYGGSNSATPKHQTEMNGSPNLQPTDKPQVDVTDRGGNSANHDKLTGRGPQTFTDKTNNESNKDDGSDTGPSFSFSRDNVDNTFNTVDIYANNDEEFKEDEGQNDTRLAQEQKKKQEELRIAKEEQIAAEKRHQEKVAQRIKEEHAGGNSLNEKEDARLTSRTTPNKMDNERKQNDRSDTDPSVSVSRDNVDKVTKLNENGSMEPMFAATLVNSNIIAMQNHKKAKMDKKQGGSTNASDIKNSQPSSVTDKEESKKEDVEQQQGEMHQAFTTNNSVQASEQREQNDDSDSTQRFSVRVDNDNGSTNASDIKNSQPSSVTDKEESKKEDVEQQQGEMHQDTITSVDIQSSQSLVSSIDCLSDFVDQQQNLMENDQDATKAAFTEQLSAQRTNNVQMTDNLDHEETVKKQELDNRFELKVDANGNQIPRGDGCPLVELNNDLQDNNQSSRSLTNELDNATTLSVNMASTDNQRGSNNRLESADSKSDDQMDSNNDGIVDERQLVKYNPQIHSPESKERRIMLDRFHAYYQKTHYSNLDPRIMSFLDTSSKNIANQRQTVKYNSPIRRVSHTPESKERRIMLDRVQSYYQKTHFADDYHNDTSNTNDVVFPRFSILQDNSQEGMCFVILYPSASHDSVDNYQILSGVQDVVTESFDARSIQDTTIFPAKVISNTYPKSLILRATLKDGSCIDSGVPLPPPSVAFTLKMGTDNSDTVLDLRRAVGITDDEATEYQLSVGPDRDDMSGIIHQFTGKVAHEKDGMLKVDSTNLQGAKVGRIRAIKYIGGRNGNRVISDSFTEIKSDEVSTGHDDDDYEDDVDDDDDNKRSDHDDEHDKRDGEEDDEGGDDDEERVVPESHQDGGGGSGDGNEHGVSINDGFDDGKECDTSNFKGSLDGKENESYKGQYVSDDNHVPNKKHNDNDIQHDPTKSTSIANGSNKYDEKEDRVMVGDESKYNESGKKGVDALESHDDTDEKNESVKTHKHGEHIKDGEQGIKAAAVVLEDAKGSFTLTKDSEHSGNKGNPVGSNIYERHLRIPRKNLPDQGSINLILEAKNSRSIEFREFIVNGTEMAPKNVNKKKWSFELHSDSE